MRILKAIDVKPRRTIRVALWSGEEQGLLGSRGYVEQHFGARSDAEEARKSKDQRPSPGRALAEARAREALRILQHRQRHRPAARDLRRSRTRRWRRSSRPGWSPLRTSARPPSPAATPAAPTTSRSTRSACPASSSSRTRRTTATRTHHTNLDVYDRLQKADLMQASVVLASFLYHAAHARGGAAAQARSPRASWGRSPRPRPRRHPIPRRTPSPRRRPSPSPTPRVDVTDRAAPSPPSRCCCCPRTRTRWAPSSAA